MSNGYVTNNGMAGKDSNKNGVTKNQPNIKRQQSYINKQYEDPKKRNSFSLFNSLKRRPKPKPNNNQFSTFSQNSFHVATHSGTSATLLRSSPRKNNHVIGPSATLLRRKKDIVSQSTNF